MCNPVFHFEVISLMRAVHHSVARSHNAFQKNCHYSQFLDVVSLFMTCAVGSLRAMRIQIFRPKYDVWYVVSIEHAEPNDQVQRQRLVHVGHSIYGFPRPILHGLWLLAIFVAVPRNVGQVGMFF